jgi:hypothetical protein
MTIEEAYDMAQVFTKLKMDATHYIDLGSYQYSSIAKLFCLYKNSPGKMQELYRNIHQNPSEFKKELYNFMEKIYNKFNDMLERGWDNLTQAEKNEFFYDIYGEDAIREFGILLHKSPFEFPVHPNLLKLSVLKYTEFCKHNAHDLWYLLSEFKKNVIQPLIDKDKRLKKLYIKTDIDIEGNIHDASVLFLLADILNIDDDIITKYFGNFDT